MRPTSLGSAALTLAILGSPAMADETTRISNSPSGRAGSAASWTGAISADGSVIAFVSAADDLVSGDTNGRTDVFAFDRSTGTTTRVSVASDGTEADGDSAFPSLSADGRYVAFISEATNLDGTIESNQNVFLHDRQLATTRLITADLNGAGGSNSRNRFTFNTSVSADGTKVAFVTSATNLVPSDTNGDVPDAFVYDASSGVMSLVSTDANGIQVDEMCTSALISGNGDVVAFFTKATNFPNPSPNGNAVIYAKDLATGAVERVDVDSSEADGWLGGTDLHGISDDGSLVLFTTQAYLVADDGGLSHAYLRDRIAGTTESVGRTTGGGPLPGPDGALVASMSGDGRFVVFGSQDAFLQGDVNGARDVFVRDRLHDVTTLAGIGTQDERSSSEVLLTTYDHYEMPSNYISADGRVIIFNSDTKAFASDDDNGDHDVYVRVRDLLPATTAHYGAGFPGRDGVIPTMTPDHDPYRGSTLSIDVTNPSGVATLGFVLVGVSRASTPTQRGGTLLVDPMIVVLLPLAATGGSFLGELPPDFWANGLVIDLQTLELDPYAHRGVSFTDGLELALGDG